MHQLVWILCVTLTCPQAQEQRIADREELIREISAKHQLKGYDHSPLEREKVAEFVTKIGDLRRRQNAETDKLQVSCEVISILHNL